MYNISNITRDFTELTKQAQNTKENGWRFKVNNYRKVINIFTELELSGTDITSTEEALEILRGGGMKFSGEKPPNWKSTILQMIDEILQNGYLKKAEEARNNPKTQAIKLLTSIPEIGPSKAEDLYQAGICSVEQLLASTDLANLVNRKQLIGLRYYQDLKERIPRQEMDQWFQALNYICQDTLDELQIEQLHMELAGSYRRGHQTSGDIDFYLALKDGVEIEGIMDMIKEALVSTGALQEDDVFSCGHHKLMGVAKLSPKDKARHLDIFLFQEKQYPFALMYATGSGEFNVRLRNHALQLGWSLSDKALCKEVAGGPVPTREELLGKIGKTKITCEQDIFRFLEIEYIEPSQRSAGVKWTKIDPKLT